MKLCKDCKHYSERPHPVFTRPYQECSHPELIGMVSGEPTECRYNRELGRCCEAGNFWEAK